MTFENISILCDISLALVISWIVNIISKKYEKNLTLPHLLVIFLIITFIKLFPQFLVKTILFLFICLFFVYFPIKFLSQNIRYYFFYRSKNKEIIITLLFVLTLYYFININFLIYFRKTKDTGIPKNTYPVLFSNNNTSISENRFTEIVLKYDFFDKFRNHKGRYKGKLEKNNNLTILQNSFGLMWETGGSSEKMNWANSQNHIQNLNSSKFAGFNDWRLPTIEELSSLMENNDSELYISKLFSENHVYCWSCDTNESETNYAWYANFKMGKCLPVPFSAKFYVKAVRNNI